MSSQLGVSEEKIKALEEYPTSDLYDSSEKVALEYADSMTITGRDVSDELFERLRSFYAEDEIVELTATIGKTRRVNSIAPCACRHSICGRPGDSARVRIP